MRIRLIPVDAPDLSVIEIRDALVGVGRDRGDFKQLPPARTTRLSERHARLYGKSGTLYVVDLGSQHGTFVNGRAIADKPVALEPGDEINFGGALPFRIELPDSGSEAADLEARDTTLVLEPMDPHSGPDPIKIQRFPFSISKSAPTFAKYAEQAGPELDFISRRHALLSRQDGRILLQDLGSTNGTFVDEAPIGADPVPLETGQKVAFGGSYFVYRVVLEGQPAARPPAQAESAKKSASVELDKTTFLAAGTSFLDILCVDDTDQAGRAGTNPAPAGTDQAESPPEATKGSRQRNGKTGLIQRIDRATWRRIQLGAVAVVAIAGALGYFILRDTPVERMESLLAAGQSDEALQVARAQAESLGDDDTFERLALRALAASSLKPWLDAYDDRDFARMERIIEAAREATPQLPESQDYLDTLALIGDVARRIHQRGGATAPFRVLDPQASEARALVERWNRPRPDKRQVTQRLLAALPSSDAELTRRYRNAYQKATSDIRALESQLAVYEPAVRQLEARLIRQLRDGALDRLAAELDAYKERYAQFRGFEALQADLRAYRELATAVSEQRVIDAVRLATTTRFHATPFTEAAARLVREGLPEQTFLDGYAEALDAWRAGQTKSALTQLEALSDDPSGEIARREVARMQGIMQGVNALQGLQGSAAYDEQLLQLYQALDPDQDAYILTLLQDKHADSRAAVEQRARRAAETAATAWTDYRAQGGITSTLRLRSGVSRAYKQRAAMLSRAARDARQARHLYALAQRRPPETQETALTEIEREVALQHQALDELTGVIANATRQDKQALLPERLR
ncbi:FHA domain-containing protein [Thiorhodococcus minor]|uniref:FHA domain-containing protein n=1 Tax=Thiorhodococcus minor TaxID=57489 RepID=A0A6M0K0N1_9GAMM|nr:FHA domain-containing protein [Thiorhodococcus minor]NEV63336.1 FHA domain-containing protein [Thiorhodococcus minor]